jgi:hypothetical protein
VFFASLVPLIALLTLTRARLRWTEGLLLLAFCAFALVSVRNVVWWGLLYPPLLARLALQIVPRPAARPVPREVPALNAALLAIIALILIVGLPWFRATNPLLAPKLRTYLEPTHPTAAVEYMRATGIHGHLFSRMEWGGYLEWEFWPGVTPLVDARVEVRPESVWRDYFAVLGANARWQAILDSYAVDDVLLERAAFPDLVREMAASPRWREAYHDDLAVLYVRANGT